MITYVEMDMFATGADCLVNTVNCEGFMSKGIAYQFKQRYPRNNEVYKSACNAGTMLIGTVLCHKENGVTIINFPTKDRWRKPSTMGYIEKGLDAMIRELPKLDVKKVAIPPLGCGNGGLSWNEVRKLIEEKLRPLDQFDFIICQPGNNVSNPAPADKDPSAKSLVLLHIEQELNRFDMLRMLCTCVFVNYYHDRDVFSLSGWNNGPDSISIKEEAKRIKAFKTAYALTSEQAYQAIYQRVCSKRTDSIITKTKAAVLKAAAFVNSINNDTVLVTAAALMHILNSRTANLYAPDDSGLLYSMVPDISDEDVRLAIQHLRDHSIISTDLCGTLHLNK